MGRRGEGVEILVVVCWDWMTWEGRRLFVLEESECVDEIGVSVIIIRILIS